MKKKTSEHLVFLLLHILFDEFPLKAAKRIFSYPNKNKKKKKKKNSLSRKFLRELQISI